MENLFGKLRKKDTGPVVPERRISKEDEYQLMEKVGQINYRIVTLMYLRRISESEEAKTNATIMIKTLQGALKIFLGGRLSLYFHPDTESPYQTGAVFSYDPDIFELPFKEADKGEKVVVVTPPLIEGIDNPSGYKTKPRVATLKDIQSPRVEDELAVNTGDPVYLFK